MRVLCIALLLFSLPLPASAQADGRITLQTLIEQLRQPLPEGVQQAGSDVSSTYNSAQYDDEEWW